VGDQERSWIELRIGITPDEAIEFLDALAEDEDLRTRLEQNPREVLLKHHIDFLPATGGVAGLIKHGDGFGRKRCQGRQPAVTSHALESNPRLHIGLCMGLRQEARAYVDDRRRTHTPGSKLQRTTLQQQPDGRKGR